MAFLNPQDTETIRRRFATDLESDVRLLLFLPATGGLTLPGQDWQIAEYIRKILTEVASLSDKVTVEEYGVHSHPEEIRRYGIQTIPAIVFLGADDYGIRYLGMPAGYEFVTLLDVVIAVSRGAAPLAEPTRQALAALPGNAHLQVFVTPT